MTSGARYHLETTCLVNFFLVLLGTGLLVFTVLLTHGHIDCLYAKPVFSKGELRPGDPVS